MEFWLSYNNNAERLRLPVNPADFEQGLSMSNTSVNITSLGDVNLIGKTGLKSISIESHFPSRYQPYCQYTDIPLPGDCIKMIESWMLTGQPIRLVITGTDINMPCSIESFNHGQKGGTGNEYYTLELKEYRFLTANSLLASAAKKNKTIARQAKTAAKAYTVKKGDTLMVIAKKTTGNSANWKKIASANGIKAPSKISIGQKLVISA